MRLKKCYVWYEKEVPSELDLEPGIGPYPFAVSGEQEWDRHHSQGDERKQTIAPSKSQLRIHLQTAKRNHGAENRAEDCVSSHRGCSVDRECIYEVGVDCHLGIQLAWEVSK